MFFELLCTCITTILMFTWDYLNWQKYSIGYSAVNYIWIFNTDQCSFETWQYPTHAINYYVVFLKIKETNAKATSILMLTFPAVGTGYLMHCSWNLQPASICFFSCWCNKFRYKSISGEGDLFPLTGQGISIWQESQGNRSWKPLVTSEAKWWMLSPLPKIWCKRQLRWASIPDQNRPSQACPEAKEAHAVVPGSCFLGDSRSHHIDSKH